ncbi:uncharacterized protein [Anabrus simplex]|uniref:uncharacterized protein isoform X2 n=1 Tax=Anabrus simplex TaxID=316456 RepID=UPI0035A383A1
MEDKVAQHKTTSTTKSDAVIRLRQYLEMLPLPSSMDPFKYWEEHQATPLHEDDQRVALYAVAGTLGGVLLCVFIFVVYLAIQVKRLKIAVAAMNSKTYFLKPNIDPNEELAKRGFSMYSGSEDGKSDRNYNSSLASERTFRNPYSNVDQNSNTQLFGSDRY